MNRSSDETKELRNDTLLSFHTIFLACVMVAGLIVGSIVAVQFGLFNGIQYLPKLLSGLPVPENGILSCLATFLCNIFISLTIILVMGISVFGIAAIPVYVLIRGFLCAIRILSYLQTGDMTDFAACAILYTPYLAVSSLVVILFAAKSMEISSRLAKDEERRYLKNSDLRGLYSSYLTSLIFAVLASLTGAVLVFIYSLFV